VIFPKHEMIDILNTIVPIFLVILVGMFIRKHGYLPGTLTGPLNRLVFYVAIPAMIFRALAEAAFETQFNLRLMVATAIPVILIFGAAICAGLLFSFQRREMGTFIQTSCHGNLGYIGFAVSFYLLGEEGLTRATIIAGFLLFLQNLLSVIGLELFSGEEGPGKGFGSSVRAVIVNPVILSSLLGVGFNLTGLPLPLLAERTLGIVSAMALPLALLVIGASLSFGLVKDNLRLVLPSSFMKLLLLPGTGFVVFRFLGLNPVEFLPALILLGAPSATVSYVMAVEFHGAPDQASAAVSLSTLFSSVTYFVWLGLVM